jgi:hypothetical protein
VSHNSTDKTIFLHLGKNNPNGLSAYKVNSSTSFKTTIKVRKERSVSSDVLSNSKYQYEKIREE